MRVTSPIPSFAGTVKTEDGSLFEGETIALDGVYSKDGAESRLTGTIVPSGSVLLGGGNTLRGRGGQVVNAPLLVVASNNRIVGDGRFTQSITLADASASVTFATAAPLEAPVLLNGGSIRLDAPLAFADGYAPVGPGTVTVGGSRLSLGSTLLTFSQPLAFNNAQDIVLSGRVSLSATWTFSGFATLSGHGNVLDLTSGGALEIAPGSQLRLVDVTLRGVQDSRLRFAHTDSRLILSNASLQFSDNLTNTVGGVLVDAQTTLLLGSNSMRFEQNASLTIDGAALLTDGGSSGISGGVTFATPSTSYLTLLESGTIREVADADLLLSTTTALAAQIAHNSNAILSFAEGVDSTSNTIFSGLTANSNTFKLLEVLVEQNSDDLVGTGSILGTSDTLAAHSNTLLTIDALVRANSNKVLSIFPAAKDLKDALIASNASAIAAAAAAGVSSAVAGKAVVDALKEARNGYTELTSHAATAGATVAFAGSTVPIVAVNAVALIAAGLALPGALGGRDSAKSAADDAEKASHGTDKNSIESSDSNKGAKDFAAEAAALANEIGTETEQEITVFTTTFPFFEVRKVKVQTKWVKDATDARAATINLRKLAESHADTAETIASNLPSAVTTARTTLEAGVRQNSDTIVTLHTLAEQNSATVVHSRDATTEALLQGSITQNSSLLVALRTRAIQNSDAIISSTGSIVGFLLNENSSLIAVLDRRITHNSDALLAADSTLLAQDAQSNSTALVALTPSVAENSNSALTLAAFAGANSYEVLSRAGVLSAFETKATNAQSTAVGAQSTGNNAQTQAVTNSNVVVAQSNAIVTLDRLIRETSNALVMLTYASVQDSNAARAMRDRVDSNSSTVVSAAQLSVENSDAIVTLDSLVAANSQYFSNQITATKSELESALTQTYDNLASRVLGATLSSFSSVEARALGNSNLAKFLESIVVSSSNDLILTDSLARATSNLSLTHTISVASFATPIAENSVRISHNSATVVGIASSFVNTSQFFANQITATHAEVVGEITATFNNLDSRIVSFSSASFPALELLVNQNSQAIVTLRGALGVLETNAVQNSDALLTLTTLLETVSPLLSSSITRTWNQFDSFVLTNSETFTTNAPRIVQNSSAAITFARLLESTTRYLEGQISSTRSEIEAQITATYININDKIGASTPDATVLVELANNNSNAIVTQQQAIMQHSNAFLALFNHARGNSSQLLTNNSLFIVVSSVAENAVKDAIAQVSASLITSTQNLTTRLSTTHAALTTKFINATPAGYPEMIERIDAHSNALITFDVRIAHNSNSLLTRIDQIAHTSALIISQLQVEGQNSSAVLALQTFLNQNSATLITTTAQLEASSIALSAHITATLVQLTTDLSTTYSELNTRIDLATPTGFNDLIDQVHNQSSTVISFSNRLAADSSALHATAQLLVGNSDTIVTLGTEISLLESALVPITALAHTATTSSDIVLAAANANASRINANSSAIVIVPPQLVSMSNSLDAAIVQNSNLIIVTSEKLAAQSDSIFTDIVTNSNFVILLNQILSGIPLASASGAVVLDSRRGENFSIDPGISIDITLSAASSLLTTTAGDVLLKAGDTLRVKGRDNVIDVVKTFSVSGDILFDPDGELTFEFNSRSRNARLFFDQTASCTLATASRLAFSGAGTVVFADGSEVCLGGSTGAMFPRLVVREGAVLELAASTTEAFTTVQMHGKGALFVEDGGEVKVGRSRQLIFGQLASDDITLFVDNGSLLDVSGVGARISLSEGVHDLICQQGGIVSVGSGAVLEVNAQSGVPRGGTLRLAQFSDKGLLNISDGGALLFADNALGSVTLWDNDDGKILGEGTVSLLSEGSLSGKVTQNRFTRTNTSVRQVVLGLLQRNTSLLAATIFIDGGGESRLRLASGEIVTLRDGDVITRDNAAGFVYGVSFGNAFMITPDGVRIGA